MSSNCINVEGKYYPFRWMNNVLVVWVEREGRKHVNIWKPVKYVRGKYENKYFRFAKLCETLDYLN